MIDLSSSYLNSNYDNFITIPTIPTTIIPFMFLVFVVVPLLPLVRFIVSPHLLPLPQIGIPLSHIHWLLHHHQRK